MYKNKFLIKRKFTNNIITKTQLSNFEYFKLYIYNLKYSKLDNCVLLNKFEHKKSKTKNTLILSSNFFSSNPELMFYVKNLRFDLLLKLINFKLLNVIPLDTSKGITFNNLKLISFNNKSNLKFLTYPTQSAIH